MRGAFYQHVGTHRTAFPQRSRLRVYHLLCTCSSSLSGLTTDVNSVKVHVLFSPFIRLRRAMARQVDLAMLVTESKGTLWGDRNAY